MTTAFSERHDRGRRFEDELARRLKERGWAVTWEAWERRYPPSVITVLNQAKADLGGPDLVITQPPFGRWAIDAKTAFPTRQQHLPGMGRFTIRAKALAALEGFGRLHAIPVLIALDEGDGYFLTPREIRDKGNLSKDAAYFFVCAAHGRPVNQIFGTPGNTAAPTVAAVTDVTDVTDVTAANEWPEDWPLEPWAA